MSIFLSKTGGKGISPHTYRLIAIACALGRVNSENLLFNYHYFIIFYSRTQVLTALKRQAAIGKELTVERMKYVHPG